MRDMALVGDAIMEVTGAYRINYAVMGNSDPYLHAHIVPRYMDEPAEMLHNHPWAYPDEVIQGRKFNTDLDAELIQKLSEAIQKKQN